LRAIARPWRRNSTWRPVDARPGEQRAAAQLLIVQKMSLSAGVLKHAPVKV
jgi:hypothetical protein